MIGNLPVNSKMAQTFAILNNKSKILFKKKYETNKYREVQCKVSLFSL